MTNAVGAGLRKARLNTGLTLAAVAAQLGISISSLSRLETGARQPSLNTIMGLSRCYGISLDDLVGAQPVGDPRVRLRPRKRNGMTVIPLSHLPGPQQALKMVIPQSRSMPRLCRHEGHEWLYVLCGRLRLIVGKFDQVLVAGQAAEFDTRTPHWFGSAGDGPVEVLSLLGRQGERIHLATLT